MSKLLLCVFRSFSSAAAPKTLKPVSVLAELRKRTGYPLFKCRDAVQKFSEDIESAERWLHEQAKAEGWSKAVGLQHRAMRHGLISTYQEGRRAAVFEILCETDFVTRNQKFISFASLATRSLFSMENVSQGSLSSQQLGSVPLLSGGMLPDELVKLVGDLKENISARRGHVICAPEGTFLSRYVHSTQGGPILHDGCQMGRYAGFLAFTHKMEPDSEEIPEISEVGAQLAQHVVGMQPLEIGHSDWLEFSRDNAKLDETEPESQSDLVPEHVTGDDSQSEEASVPYDDSEFRMLFQNFLADPSYKVGEFIEENFVEILNIWRFHCGEPLDSDKQEE